MTTFLFFLCAVLAVAGALGVISARNPLHSAMSLVGTMVALAIIYLLFHTEYIFVIQIAVYAGAVMMLILYVIFLLDIRTEEARKVPLQGAKIVGVGASGLMFLALMVPVAGSLTGRMGDMTEGAMMQKGSVQIIGDALFGPYLLPFEVASVLLLVGLVGAVTLAKKKL